MALYEQMNLTQVLDDLQTFNRFIINIPDEELSSIERICFQIEQAHWYYEDFVREQNPALPSFSLKSFTALFFRHCPLLDGWAHDHEKAFDNFMQYKVRVPVCGAIVLNEKLDKALLVRGWKASSNWSFPRGKINKEEKEIDCAVREVTEETGFDISPFLRENDYVEILMKEQRIRLYIVHGVSEDTIFETKTRKEIGAIQWFKLMDLPGWKHGNHNIINQQQKSGSKKQRFYMVTVFMGSLRKWIAKYKKQKKSKKHRKGIQVTSGYRSGTDADSDTDTQAGLIVPDYHQTIAHNNPADVLVPDYSASSKMALGIPSFPGSHSAAGGYPYPVMSMGIPPQPHQHLHTTPSNVSPFMSTQSLAMGGGIPMTPPSSYAHLSPRSMMNMPQEHLFQHHFTAIPTRLPSPLRIAEVPIRSSTSNKSSPQDHLTHHKSNLMDILTGSQSDLRSEGTFEGIRKSSALIQPPASLSHASSTQVHHHASATAFALQKLPPPPAQPDTQATITNMTGDKRETFDVLADHRTSLMNILANGDKRDSISTEPKSWIQPPPPPSYHPDLLLKPHASDSNSGNLSSLMLAPSASVSTGMNRVNADKNDMRDVSFKKSVSATHDAATKKLIRQQSVENPADQHQKKKKKKKGKQLSSESSLTITTPPAAYMESNMSSNDAETEGDDEIRTMLSRQRGPQSARDVYGKSYRKLLKATRIASIQEIKSGDDRFLKNEIDHGDESDDHDDDEEQNSILSAPVERIQPGDQYGFLSKRSFKKKNKKPSQPGLFSKQGNTDKQETSIERKVTKILKRGEDEANLNASPSSILNSTSLKKDYKTSKKQLQEMNHVDRMDKQFEGVDYENEADSPLLTFEFDLGKIMRAYDRQ